MSRVEGDSLSSISTSQLEIGIGRNLTVPPSHATWHTGPYQGGSIELNVKLKHSVLADPIHQSN